MADSAQTRPPDSVRASDADRDHVAQRLADALAEGRLTHDEHSERLDAVYAAKTLGELEPLTRDLPATVPATAPAGTVEHPEPPGPEVAPAGTGTGHENIIAVLSAAERRDRWLVEPRTNVSGVLGGVELDLRHAVLSQREVVLQCAMLLSGLTIIVPPGVRVLNRTSGILGGVKVDAGGFAAPTSPDAPTVVLSGLLFLGGIDVRTREVGAEK
ncbi:DUF1707 SHOCT-like domain-containing protein [Marinitenerispora sediminis]|uniref:DUF1707 domain-containing protein n=1 Tax=Marinitenerispora sediminis TaxID=1931232 RepID=A0A368TB69_9ACTN|nr:DUF1707 domain-containing protein [Marinitenerispora sediminis]RCV53654.1 hypothetical protein DEF28_09990 [Marinitenerispora sediminis]RCV57362.1 hypothetical protein DEF23_10890 [Marinitenerispora sediminis]RCV62358.1 hypothetical protein DEF24_01600 [Marinitenerispora sediminis]